MSKPILLMIIGGIALTACLVYYTGKWDLRAMPSDGVFDAALAAVIVGFIGHVCGKLCDEDGNDEKTDPTPKTISPKQIVVVDQIQYQYHQTNIAKKQQSNEINI